MKTIVLIGKADERLRVLDACLRKYFRVQLCTEGPQNAIATIKVTAPQLIVVSLSGLGQADRGLFVDIQREARPIPVLMVGSDAEKLAFGSFYWDDQFKHLASPRGEDELLAAVCERLGVSLAQLQSGALDDDGRKKVLVVDDNANTLRSIKAMLEDRYNVTLANSGMKALTSIGKSRPDVILLDYEMPVCDGRQTLEMIRADEDMADIPVIFLTSVNDKEHIHAVIKLLPAGYLLKPAVPERLIETIEAALQPKG